MTRKVKKIAAGITRGAAKGGFDAAAAEALSMGRTAWLAGLGAVAATGEVASAALAAAGEQASATFDALVAKGKRKRETPAERVERLVAETSREATRVVESTGRAVYARASELLAQLGVPSGAEIRTLKARVEALRARLS